MKFHNFLEIFPFLWIIFALLYMDADSVSGSGSNDLIESGSNLEPKHCSNSVKQHFWILCQVMLYSMMSRDRREDPRSGLLLYLRYHDRCVYAKFKTSKNLWFRVSQFC